MSEYYSLGLMSGSSLDGLDICYSKISVKNQNYSYELIDGQTIKYPVSLFNQLQKCRILLLDELQVLDELLGEFFGFSCSTFCKERNITKIDFICSHGHTVYHYPKQKQTLQIGSGQIISNITGIQTITTLRSKDIEAGGSGAPIVPLGDLLFFPKHRFCLNLGGIMNISDKTTNGIISFDIGVCNQVINHYASFCGLDFDKDGKIAFSGSFNLELFNELNSQIFFSLPSPKSLDNGFSKELIRVIDQYNINIADKLHTFYHHIGYQILRSSNKTDSILATGGGAHNLFLIDLLRSKYHLQIDIPSTELIDYKEALVMSLLGLRFIENKFNVLSSVTGATHNTQNGELFLPYN